MNIEQVKAAYAREQQNKKPARCATDLPLSFEEITDEWLTATICGKHPGAEVIQHSFGHEDEGNTSRRRLNLSYNAKGQEAGLPLTVFVKASFRLNTRISVGIPGGLEAETIFFNDIRALLDINAPVGVWAGFNPETLNSVIMLQDLGPGTEFCTLETAMSDDRLYDQMALLAKLHSRFYNRPELDQLSPNLATWPEYFSKAAGFGMESICASGFEAAKDVMPPRIYARAAEVWPATMQAAERHNTLPRMLIHTDVHLRNWFIRDGKIGLTDWQGATKGHWSRDVAYTISSCTPFYRRREMEPKLLQFYLDRMADAGIFDTSFDEAHVLYRQQLFGALAWWTVTMPHPALPNMQPVETTRELIRRITQAIDDTDAFASF